MADIGYEELAAHILGVDIDDNEVYDSLEDLFYEKYDIDLSFYFLGTRLQVCGVVGG
jgi:hypothetical protein